MDSLCELLVTIYLKDLVHFPYLLLYLGNTLVPLINQSFIVLHLIDENKVIFPLLLL